MHRAWLALPLMLPVAFFVFCAGPELTPFVMVVPRGYVSPVWIVLDPEGQDVPLVFGSSRAVHNSPGRGPGSRIRWSMARMWGGPIPAGDRDTGPPRGLVVAKRGDSVWHRGRPPVGKSGNYRVSAHQRPRDSPSNR